MAEEEITNSQVQILKSIKDTELELKIVLMGKKFEIGELLNLGPGGVLMFDVPATTPAKLAVNSKTFATGTVVETGERYGLQVGEVIGQGQDKPAETATAEGKEPAEDLEVTAETAMDE